MFAGETVVDTVRMLITVFFNSEIQISGIKSEAEFKVKPNIDLNMSVYHAVSCILTKIRHSRESMPLLHKPPLLICQNEFCLFAETVAFGFLFFIFF